MTLNQDDLIGVRLSVHNKALGSSLQSRTKLSGRNWSGGRTRSADLEEAMEIARRGYEVILHGLKALPQNVAQRCNPTDPTRAMTVLESECTAILGRCAKGVCLLGLRI